MKLKIHAIIFLTTLGIVLMFPTILYAASVTALWDPPITNEDGSQLTDLAGFKLYYGPTTGGTIIRDIPDPAQTELVLDGLAEGTAYRFAMTAYNESGLESVKTDWITVEIPEPIQVPPNPPHITIQLNVSVSP